MKFSRHNLVNVAIAATAALLFLSFVALATRGGDKRNEELDAIAASTTTTTRRVTTTTSTTEASVTPTTAQVAPAPTSAPATVTTARPATPTTRRSSPATTVRTTTTQVPSPSGPATERSDNRASFADGQDGSFNASSTDPPAGPDPFRFVIRTAAGSGGTSGETASVKFTVSLTNNSARNINFPGGLRVVVTMRAPNGTDVVFTMTASDVTNITPGETITITQERGVAGYGSFDVTATCDVDYG